MDDKLVTNITDSVERVLRYIIPGVAFSLLFTLAYPGKFDSIILRIIKSNLAVFLVILTIGMSIYVVYSLIIRFTLERIVFKQGKSPVNLFCNDKCLSNYSRAHAKLLLNRKESEYYPGSYYTYLWSITHYSLILSVLIIIFTFLNEKDSWLNSNSIIIGIIGIGILILSIYSYYYMQALEKETTAENIKADKNSKNNTGNI